MYAAPSLLLRVGWIPEPGADTYPKVLRIICAAAPSPEPCPTSRESRSAARAPPPCLRPCMSASVPSPRAMAWRAPPKGLATSSVEGDSSRRAERCLFCDAADRRARPRAAAAQPYTAARPLLHPWPARKLRVVSLSLNLPVEPLATTKTRLGTLFAPGTPVFLRLVHAGPLSARCRRCWAHAARITYQAPRQ